MEWVNVDHVAQPDAEQVARGDHPCFLCGKATKGERQIHLHTRGFIVPVDEEIPEEHDQGWFDIGPECAKKLPKGFVARDAV